MRRPFCWGGQGVDKFLLPRLCSCIKRNSLEGPMPSASPIVVDSLDHGPTLTRTYAHARPGDARADGVPPEVVDRLTELSAMADLSARSYGSEINNLIDARNTAIADLEVYKRSCRDAHLHPDEREVARLQARVDRATRTLKLANEELKKFPATLPSLARACASLVGKLQRSGDMIIWHGAVDVPKGATVESVRANIDEMLAQRDKLDTALPPIEEARAQLRRDFDKLAGDGIGIDLEINHSDLSGRARPPHVRLSLPKERVAHIRSDNPGYPPTVTSAVGIVAAVLGDQIWKVIDDQLTAFYAANKHLVRTEMERRKEIAQIDAKVLDLSRAEAQLCWDAIAGGGKASFRADLDPKAVLGIA